MSRHVVVCSLLIGALAGCDTFFPGNSGGRSGRLTGLDPDGGVCTKDPQAIKNVMLAPPACNATNPCPCGTFCSSQTGGNCVADCVDDSWCAPGHTCSGYGQCLAATDGGAGDGGPGPSVDPACPRNEALLDSLQTMRRSCQFDDGCPFGSFCNHVTETCDIGCRSDAQCAAMAAPGQTLVCGCLGQCAEVAAPRVRPTQVLGNLELTPSQFGFARPANITAPNWGDVSQRKIGAVVSVPFLTGTPGSLVGPAVTIQANPGPGLLVACPGSTTFTGGCSFAVDVSTYKKTGDVYRSAPVYFTVQPSTDASFATVTSWTLRFESKDLGNVPKAVFLRYDDQINTLMPPTPVAVSAPDPSFTGVGRVEMFTPTGAPVRLNVKARAWNGNLVLFDETQQLSPSGKLVLVGSFSGSGSQYVQTFVNPELRNDVSLQSSFTGRSSQVIVSAPTLLQDTASGNLSGTFDRVINISGWTQADPSDPFHKARTVSFALNKSAPSAVGACSGNSDCPAGSCDLGFCSALPPHRFWGEVINTTDVDWFTHFRMAKWGPHYPGSDFTPTTHPPGFWGLYLPSSFYLGQASFARNGYSLHGPVARISGEPLADVVDQYGYPLLSNLRQVAVPLLTQHDGNFTPQSAPNLLKSCLADLARDRQTATLVNFSREADPDVFDAFVNCINLGRLSWVLADHTTLQRGLQAWLEVHSFVMREGLEEIQAAAANGGVPGNSDPNASPPTLEQILAAGESGLGFLIDQQRFGGYFGNPEFTGDQIASEVDYRSGKINQFCDPTKNQTNKDVDCNGGDGTVTLACDPGTDTCQLRTLNELPQHEQPIGVPAYLLEATASYLKVLDAYVQKIARQTYGQAADANPANGRQTALSRFGTGMRLAWYAEELAVAINAEAPCPAGNPNCGVIAQRFNAARDEMNAVRERVVAGADALQNGRNPLNIPEDDVPLFFGDPTGTNSRYFAASDYLLDGWAVPAVAQASAALDAARAAWIQKMQSAVQDELNQHNRQQEIDQQNSKYGATILANCGSVQVPDVDGGIKLLDSSEIIPYYSDPTKEFSNTTCFVDASCIGFDGLDGKEALRSALNTQYLDAAGNLIEGKDPQSLGDTRGTVQAASAALLFVHAEICRITGLKTWRPNDKFLTQLATLCPLQTYNPTNNGSNSCLVVKMDDGNLYIENGPEIPLAALFMPIRKVDTGPNGFYKYASHGDTLGTVTFGGGADEENIYDWENYRADNSPLFMSISSNGTVTQTIDTVASEFPHLVCADGRGFHLKEDFPPPDRTVLPATCFKGALGVAFQENSTQLLRLSRAKEVLDTGRKNLDDQKDLCEKIDSDAKTLIEKEGHYVDMKHDYEVVSHLAGAIKDGFSGLSSGGPIGGIASLFGSGLLGAFGTEVDDEANAVQFLQIEFSSEEKQKECWNTFMAQRRALATAMTDIQIAATELDAQLVKYNNLQRDNVLAIKEGVAAYQRELDSPVGSLSHTFWVDERIQTFKETFEWARRLTFIAMRAVEYEFQQSLPYRSDIVSAETAADLQKVVIGLKQEQAARTINRRRPDEASIVLSLRDDVLAVADNSDAPAGERNWTPAQRFESRLYDQQYAYRDSAGNYLGQAIPFSMGPTGILETRCGERLWRATATIQGDGIAQSAPGASILLLKRNSFQSQYCAGKAPAAPDGSTPKMQPGVIHTSADLFQPGSAVDLSDANEFTASLLYPWFNIPRTQFYATTYQQGSSEELAGRGLYGDYVLLFPKQVLDDGFALDKVEDVLLRLDYLSVDNLSQ